MAGQGKTRGTSGVAEIPLCTNQSICSIIPYEKVALVDFLYYQMQWMYKELRSISNGDGGRGGLNLKLIGGFPVILPSLNHQNEFAQKIEAIEKQKELVKRSIVETETLFDSRMDYWFN
jgi:type I restriction enzyme S subunit